MTVLPCESKNTITIPPHDEIELNVFKFGIFKASFRALALLVIGGLACASLYMLALKQGYL
jgi:hypothetical protein